MSARAAVDALLAAVATRDVDAVVAATKGGRIDVVPLGLKGAASTKAKDFFGPLFISFPDLEISVGRTVVAGNKAMVDLVLTGTQKEPYLDIPLCDGKSLTLRQAWVLEADGKAIATLKIFFCRNELKWSLGANKSYEEAIAGVGA
jgi:hypothetical protein